MVNWHDPAIVTADERALVNFLYVIGGIYIWEFISCFGFEYSVITKKRKFTWSFLLYLGCRWCPLFAITSQFLGSDVSHEIDCQAQVVLTFMFADLSFIFASALVILRVAVLWNRNKFVIAFACAVLLGNTAVYAYSICLFPDSGDCHKHLILIIFLGLATISSAWTGSSCTVSHTVHSRIGVLSTVTTDVILLVLMLTGLMRWKHAPKAYGVWRLLYTQGLIWIVVLTLAEVPPTVFVLLNLNDPLNLMFQELALILMALGAARIYRGLVDYPAFNSSAKVVNDTETAKGLNSESLSPFAHQSWRTTLRQDAEGGPVVLDTLLITTSGSEVRRGETFEGGNVV